jgi:hypothetical protein
MAVIFFNLFINATFSLMIGLGLVLGCNRMLRANCGPWKVFLLSLPFVKVVYDFFKGVPYSSILITNIDPYRVPPGFQQLRVGVSLNNFIPQIQALFTIHDLDGNKYGASIGDYFVFWLARNFSPEFPLYMVYGITAIAILLLARRAVLAIRFEIQRRADRKLSVSFENKKLTLRKVDIYISHTFSGTPFTGGVLRPYICIPRDAFETLTPAELNAVIAHELGHVQQLDLMITMSISFLGDIFWFVPGYRWLCQKLERMREVIADQRAVRAGAPPEVLASALIKLKEVAMGEGSLVFYTPFLREKALLKVRIENLIGSPNEKPPRWMWRNIWGRSFVTFWLIGAVLSSNLGGNHSTAQAVSDHWVRIFAGLFS